MFESCKVSTVTPTIYSISARSSKNVPCYDVKKIENKLLSSCALSYREKTFWARSTISTFTSRSAQSDICCEWIFFRRSIGESFTWFGILNTAKSSTRSHYFDWCDGFEKRSFDLSTQNLEKQPLS